MQAQQLWHSISAWLSWQAGGPNVQAMWGWPFKSLNFWLCAFTPCFELAKINKQKFPNRQGFLLENWCRNRAIACMKTSSLSVALLPALDRCQTLYSHCLICMYFFFFFPLLQPETRDNWLHCSPGRCIKKIYTTEALAGRSADAKYHLTLLKGLSNRVQLHSPLRGAQWVDGCAAGIPQGLAAGPGRC